MSEFDPVKEQIEALKRHYVAPESEQAKQVAVAVARQESFDEDVDRTCKTMALGGTPALPGDTSLDTARLDAVMKRMRDKSLPPRQRDAMARYADRLNRRLSGLRWS